jgi:hypothetical protein
LVNSEAATTIAPNAIPNSASTGKGQPLLYTGATQQYKQRAPARAYRAQRW